MNTNPDKTLATAMVSPDELAIRPRVPCIRAEELRQGNDGDVMITATYGGHTFEVAVDDPLTLIAVAMGAIKFGHSAKMMAAAKQLVDAFTPLENS
jgi:hypothetical protein